MMISCELPAAHAPNYTAASLQEEAP